MGNLQSFEHQKRRPSPPSRSPFARPVHQASMEPLAVLPIQQQKGSHLSWNIANISLSPDPATLPSPASGFSDLMDRRPFIGAREPRPDGQLAPPPAFHHFVASVVQRRVRDEKHKQDLFPKKNTTGLPDTLKAGVERLSGFSLDDVHVHYNSSKPIQAGALAYTLGTDIHVGPGQERHLGHEAWHVVQQKQARVTPTIELDRIAINDDDRLEREADIMGARAAMDNTLARSKESDRRSRENRSVSQTSLSSLTFAGSPSQVMQRVKIGTGKSALTFTKEENQNFQLQVSVKTPAQICDLLREIERAFGKSKDKKDREDLVWAHISLSEQLALSNSLPGEERTIETFMRKAEDWRKKQDQTSTPQKVTPSLTKPLVIDLSDVRGFDQRETSQKQEMLKQEADQNPNVLNADSIREAKEREIEKRRRSGKERALTIAFHRGKKQYVVGQSNGSSRLWKRDEDGHVQLKKPRPTLEPLRKKLDTTGKEQSLDREVWVCGEVDAAVRALKAGFQLGDLEFTTVKVQERGWQALPRCAHCKQWAHGYDE